MHGSTKFNTLHIRNESIHSQSKKRKLNDNKKWDFSNNTEIFKTCYLKKLDDLDTYEFRGLIAYSRLLKKKKCVVLVGYDFGKFFEIIYSDRNLLKYTSLLVNGKCRYMEKNNNYVYIK